MEDGREEKRVVFASVYTKNVHDKTPPNQVVRLPAADH